MDSGWRGPAALHFPSVSVQAAPLGPRVRPVDLPSTPPPPGKWRRLARDLCVVWFGAQKGGPGKWGKRMNGGGDKSPLPRRLAGLRLVGMYPAGLALATARRPCVSGPAWGVWGLGGGWFVVRAGAGRSAPHLLEPLILARGDSWTRRPGHRRGPQRGRPAALAALAGAESGPRAWAGRRAEGGSAAARAPQGRTHAFPGTLKPRGAAAIFA